jgi:hypothetical protein
MYTDCGAAVSHCSARPRAGSSSRCSARPRAGSSSARRPDYSILLHPPTPYFFASLPYELCRRLGCSAGGCRICARPARLRATGAAPPARRKCATLGRRPPRRSSAHRAGGAPRTVPSRAHAARSGLLDRGAVMRPWPGCLSAHPRLLARCLNHDSRIVTLPAAESCLRTDTARLVCC